MTGRIYETHPNTGPNPKTSIACPEVFHGTVSDAKTDEEKTNNDVYDSKNPRHVGSLQKDRDLWGQEWSLSAWKAKVRRYSRTATISLCG